MSTSNSSQIDSERHRLRVALDELAVAQRVYAANPAMLSMIKSRAERIKDRLYELDRQRRAASAK